MVGITLFLRWLLVIYCALSFLFLRAITYNLKGEKRPLYRKLAYAFFILLFCGLLFATHRTTKSVIIEWKELKAPHQDQKIERDQFPAFLTCPLYDNDVEDDNHAFKLAFSGLPNSTDSFWNTFIGCLISLAGPSLTDIPDSAHAKISEDKNDEIARSSSSKSTCQKSTTEGNENCGADNSPNLANKTAPSDASKTTCQKSTADDNGNNYLFDFTEMQLFVAKGQRGEFYKANFKNSILHWANFKNANFYGANLDDVKAYFSVFSGAELSGSRWNNARIVYCDYSDAILCGTDFSNSKLYGIYARNFKIDKNCNAESNFSEIEIQDSIFEGVEFSNIDFSTAIFDGVLFLGYPQDAEPSSENSSSTAEKITDETELALQRFFSVTPTESELSDVKSDICQFNNVTFGNRIENTHFESCSFSNVKVLYATGLDNGFRGASFRKTPMSGLSFPETSSKCLDVKPTTFANFSSSYLEKVDFTGLKPACALRHAQLDSMTYFNSIKFDSMNLEYANFKSIQILKNDVATEVDWVPRYMMQIRIDNQQNAPVTTYLSFEHANLKNASFEKSLLNGAFFIDSNLSSADFTRSEINQAVFHDSNAKNAVFLEANGRGADFKDAILIDATFTNAILYEASFSKADLSASNFSAADLRKANLNACRYDRRRFGTCRYDRRRFGTCRYDRRRFGTCRSGIR